MTAAPTDRDERLAWLIASLGDAVRAGGRADVEEGDGGGNIIVHVYGETGRSRARRGAQRHGTSRPWYARRGARRAVIRMSHSQRAMPQ